MYLCGNFIFSMRKCLSLPQNVIFAPQNDDFANVVLKNDIEIHTNIFDYFKLKILYLLLLIRSFRIFCITCLW